MTDYKDTKAKITPGPKPYAQSPTVKAAREALMRFTPTVNKELFRLYLDPETHDKDKILIARLIYDFCMPKPIEIDKGNNDAMERFINALKDSKGPEDLKETNNFKDVIEAEVTDPKN